jgi:hypothetical protein
MASPWSISRRLRPILVPLRTLDADRRSLPDFVILGAQRAGSTTLYRALVGHPQVRRALLKEIHYFDLNYERGLRWYRAHFPHPKRGTITGEASPYYLFHPRVPQRVAGDLPDARFLVVMRDPVARAYSQYRLGRQHGSEPLATFEDAIDAEDERLAADAERFASDETYRSRAHASHSYLARGRYAEQLERWFDAVPRERFFVIASETLWAEPEETYGRAVSFLGLKPHELGGLPTMGSASGSKLKPETEKRLREYFAPHNERLRRLLGEPLPWPD